MFEAVTQPFVLVVAALVVVLAGVLIFVVSSGGGGQSDSDAVQTLTDTWQDFPHDLASGYEVGQNDAPLTITQYEDFQCPFCLRYTVNNEPGIISDYVKAGKVKLVFQNLPILGTESVSAARAAECASQQDKFWELHHELFLLQAESGQISNERTNVGRFSDDALRGLAQDAGLDMTKYDTCYADPKTLETVQEQKSAAQSYGFTGTPSFLFNNVPLSAPPANIEGWKQAIDAQLEQIAGGGTTTPGTGTPGTGTTTPEATAETTPTAAVEPTATPGT